MNKQQAMAKAKENVNRQAINYRDSHLTSAAPTGLKISRDGNKYTLTWKINGDNYGDGIQVAWRVVKSNTSNPVQYTAWTSISVGSSATSASFTLNTSGYFPNTQTKILAIEMRVRGNKKKFSQTFSNTQSYTETQNKKNVTKKYTYSQKIDFNSTWSEWSHKTFNISAPDAPSIGVAVSDTYSNVSTFSWSAPNPADNGKPLTDIEWQLAIVKDSNATTGSGYVAGGTTGASGSTVRTEDSSTLADGHSYRRWVRVRARGLGGVSAWREASHVYAQPNAASNVRATAAKSGGTFNCQAWWNSSSSFARPVDKISVQYVFAEPEQGLTCPSGLSWSDGIDLAYKDGSDSGRFSVDDTLTEDQCLFVRVNTEYNAIYQSNYGKTFGTPILVASSKLKSPSKISVATEQSTHKATITATNNSGVEGSFLAVIYQGTKEPNKRFVVGIIPAGEDSTIAQCPNWSGEDAISFGVYAVEGQYRKQVRSDGADSYAITAYSGKPLMVSDTVWEGGEVPLAPSGVTVESTDVKGSVRVKWNWSWRNATGAEIAWADHRDAWESTDAPDTYVVSNLYEPQWNIAGLTLGTEWYVRVRFVREVADTTVYSPWSDLTEASTINLSSPPETPSLNLSSPFVIEGGDITASWAYISTDGTPQSFAEIREVTITSGGVTYGKRVATAHTEQSVIINAKTAGWTEGNIYSLAIRVTSGSGKESEQWSSPVSVTVVKKLTCAVSSTSLVNGVLKEMPLTIAVNHGEGVTHTLAIERAESYYLDRPDESVFTGHEGETVAIATGNTDGQFSIGTGDLIGAMDDGVKYRIIATSADAYGQSASAELTFTVGWSHQALMPEASAFMYDDDYVSIIKVEKPDGALDTDVCDIYRLSADKPQLIIEGAELGRWYVDPYPAIGQFGGHRVVLRTANGDCITSENQIASVDVQENDYLGIESALVDFNGDRVELEYNLDLSHSWQKDFKETKYLGGSVQGDWNPAISRNSTIASVVLDITDFATIQKMRRLSNHAGLCHVRTPDGSSYFADVQVSEDSGYDTGHHVISYSLSATRVDPQEMEGMTYEEWCHITKIASGSIASFSDGAGNIPLVHLRYYVDPLIVSSSFADRTVINANYSGKDASGAEQYTIIIPSTKGGYADLIEGRFYAYPYYASYAGEDLTGEWISNMDAYDPETTPTIGAKVINIGGIPTESDITAVAVECLDGINRAWCDTGHSEVEYKVDVEIYEPEEEEEG